MSRESNFSPGYIGAYGDQHPRIAEDVFLAPGSVVVGDDDVVGAIVKDDDLVHFYEYGLIETLNSPSGVAVDVQVRDRVVPVGWVVGVLIRCDLRRALEPSFDEQRQQLARIEDPSGRIPPGADTAVNIGGDG